MRSAPALWWLLVLFIAGVAIFYGLGAWHTMDPHVKGWVGPHHGYHRFDDDGDRALHAFMYLLVAGAGVWGAIQLVQMQRKEVADRRWQWEVVVDGQVIQRPPPTADNIRDDMTGFDGRLAACDLLDKETGTRVWCYGEPDRRVVEMRRFGDGGQSGEGDQGNPGWNGDYRLARRDCPDTEPVQLAGPQPVTVAAREILSAAQALEIVLAVFAGRPIGDSYVRERFGPREDLSGAAGPRPA